MPGAKSTATSNASKRVRTESARKREGRENTEALKRERAGQHAAAKARKTLRDEAADDELLVEREGESPDVVKLRTYALQLESDNQRMKAKLVRRAAQDNTPSVKVIPAPDNKGNVTVELLRRHLDLFGDEHDVQWSMLRHDFRALLVAGGLDWDKTWSKQDIDRVNTLYHAAENRRPEMKMFANHWGTEFLLKESFANIYSYYHQQSHKHLDSTNSGSPGDDDDDDRRKAAAHKAAAHKAAAYRAAERKAAKRKADTPENDEHRTDQDADDALYNDGDTEIEDLPDETHRAIERDEIGVPDELSLPAKAPAKCGTSTPSTSLPKVRRDVANLNASTSSTSSPKARKDMLSPPSGSQPRPMIRLKRGRGGKVRAGRQGGRGSVPVADVLPATSSLRDVVSSSSGQTTSASEED